VAGLGLGLRLHAIERLLGLGRLGFVVLDPDFLVPFSVFGDGFASGSLHCLSPRGRGRSLGRFLFADDSGAFAGHAAPVAADRLLLAAVGPSWLSSVGSSVGGLGAAIGGAAASAVGGRWSGPAPAGWRRAPFLAGGPGGAGRLPSS